MKSRSEYNIWKAMIRRCMNSNNKVYYRYGGRGINVCARWLESFETFFQDVGPRPSPEHSIDRINNDGDYEPSNVRWATWIEQANNSRRNRIVEYRGARMTMTQAARLAGLSEYVVAARIYRGWSATDALAFPPMKNFERRPT